MATTAASWRAILVLALSFAALASAAQQGGGFDRESFDLWLEARVGDGSRPVYWYSIGRVAAYPSGETLALLEGFDTARLERSQEDPNTAYQLSRKIFVYRDPATGEVLREFEGRPVDPIGYPYQFITYKLAGDGIETWVEQGSGSRLRRMGPSSDMSARRIGDTLVVTAPVFLDFPTPAGRYQAFENYDFFIRPGSEPRSRFQLSWLRYGERPAFAGEGPAIIHLVSWRVDRYEDLPERIRRYVDEEAPLWQAPPRDLEEIRSLQSGDGDG